MLLQTQLDFSHKTTPNAPHYGVVSVGRNNEHGTTQQIMADKFPALDVGADVDENIDSDFLSREKELLGDEFKTENDKEALNSDDEFTEFNEQFPEVDQTEPAQHQQPEAYEEPAYEAPRDLGDSKALNDWKERRDLEIAEREKVNARTKEEIVKKAQQTIDDFYENYNTKREQSSQQVLKDEEQFLEKRDKFLSKGTLWDRVNELTTEVGETLLEDRDKSRFRKILKNLKGKEKVPGAGGY